MTLIDRLPAAATPRQRRTQHTPAAAPTSISPLAVAKAAIVGLFALSGPAAALARQPATLGGLRPPGRTLQDVLSCTDGSNRVTFEADAPTLASFGDPCTHGVVSMLSAAPAPRAVAPASGAGRRRRDA